MRIQGPANVHGAQPINGPHQIDSAKSAEETTATSQADQLDISHEAELASKVAELSGQVQDIPDVRADRIANIREAIEQGTYETEDKLDIALDRFIDETSS
jgi:negative regulator of flagellin synthesis FlgM|tara:strand:- start:105 stop:407 length:303 start_codon:yes stop_codon:yes gene_type:complete